jgi:HEPN domain-containing protein
VEKYLKGRLEEAGSAFPKTHDVLRLLDLILPMEPLWLTIRPAMSTIGGYAVETRYPARNATAAETRMLVKMTTHIRMLVR